MAQPLAIAPQALCSDSHLPMPQWPRRAALALQWELRVLLDGLRQHDSERSKTRRAAVMLTLIVTWFFFITACALLAAAATLLVPPFVVWRCARDLWGSA